MATILSAAALKRGALTKSGELTDGTSQYDAKAEEYLNRVYDAFMAGSNEFDLDLGLPWPWAKARNGASFLVNPTISTLAITTTLNSTSATFSTTPTVSYAGYYLVIPGYPTFYRIVTHSASSASLTLDIGAVDAAVTNASCRLYALDYNLTAGIQRMIAPFRVYQNQYWDGDDEGKIYATDYDHMMRDFPLHRIENGVATRFAETARTTDGVITVRLNRVNDTPYKVEYDYIPYATPLFSYVFTDSSYTSGSGVFSVTGYSPSNGDQVILDADQNSLITAFRPATRYYVVGVSGSTFKLSSTSGGSAITGGSAGSGTYFVSNEPILPNEHRPALEYAVAALLQMDKVDPRATDTYTMAKQKLEAIIAAYSQETAKESKDKGRLIPRLDRYALSKRYVRQEPTP